MRNNLDICDWHFSDDDDWIVELNLHVLDDTVRILEPFPSPHRFPSIDFHELRGQFNDYPYQRVCRKSSNDNGKCIAYAGENAFFLENV